MAKLNDFIRALELCVEKDNMVPSAEEINLAIRRAAVPVVKNGQTWFRFADGEMLSIDSCEKYAQMLVA